jgi:hypothetical protein
MKKSTKFLFKITLSLFIFSQGFYVFLVILPQKQKVISGNLTASSDTLSNSRLSYSGKVSGAHTAGATTINLQSGTGNAPDINTNHLFPKDVVSIGPNGLMTVSSIVNTTSFTNTAGLTVGVADGTNIYATQSATHTISSTTASTVNEGAIRILIPATDQTSSSNDGAPDNVGFDFNSITSASITCPTYAGVSWQTPSATASSSFGQNYHAFECRFAGSVPASTALTMVVGGTKKLINPAPKSTHTQGTADTYNVKVQILGYPQYNIIDSTIVTVSPTEAVLVSSTINPSLTFTIGGIAASQTYCGITTTVATTFDTVPFGDINSISTFYNAAHQIQAATNAPSGYTIKVAEDDNLRKDGSTYIVDTGCDSGKSCTAGSSGQGQWQTTTTAGWGYSLHNSTATTVAFNYNDTSGGNCAVGTTYCAKPFACNNLAGGCVSTTAEQQIANSSAPSSTQTFYVCYRLNASGTQATGYYQTRVIYYASATF